MSREGDEEAHRLARVFRSYSQDLRFRSRWDPQNPGNRRILAERVRTTQVLLDVHGLWPPVAYRILDVGCGAGAEIARFQDWGALPADLVGVDLIEDRVREARAAHPHIDFRHGDASKLEFAQGSFRLALLFTVMSSVLEPRLQQSIASEVDRILEPGGCVLWYDFRVSDPRNRNTRGITSNRLRALFPLYETDLRRVTVLPPLTRRLGGSASVLYPLLSLVPFLRTHYLGLLRKPSERAPSA